LRIGITQPSKINTNQTQTKMHSLMFQLAARAVKYYLLVLFGFFTACLMAAIFGMFPAIEWVLLPLVGYLWRLAALILSFMAIALVLESIRQ
jgi:hypothetical protein